MNTQIINVEEKDVMSLQYKDAKVKTLEQVMVNFLNEHQRNEDISFMDTPIYKEFQNRLVKAKIDFMNEKDKIADKYIDKDKQNDVQDWSLNYISNELIVNFV